MLQAEKSRLVTAIQACEAATASVSRPGSPMTDQETTYSEKELNVKAKLEDLIDQVILIFVFIQPSLIVLAKSINWLNLLLRQKHH